MGDVGTAMAVEPKTVPIENKYAAARIVTFSLVLVWFLISFRFECSVA